MDLLHWWNLIFLLPAAAALILLLLLTLGAVPSEGFPGDVDVHVDTGLDAPDAGHIASHPEAAHAAGDPFLGALSLIGVGRAPLSLVLLSFGLLWGFVGVLANRVFASFIASPAVYVWPSMAVALVGAGAVTRVLAMSLGRLMPATESYGAATRELVGRIADVRYPLTETGGAVQLHDAFGALHEVPARVMPGEPVIPAGTRVILWRYDDNLGAYFAVHDETINGIEAVDPHRNRFSIR